MRLVYTDDRKRSVEDIPNINEPIVIETPVGTVRVAYVDGLKLQVILVTGGPPQETSIKLNERNLA